MLFNWTYARHRIRHGIRHTAAGAGRHPCPSVANGRLRHMLIGDARVSKADGSQSLDLQRDALQAAGVDARHVYHDCASGVRDDRPGLDSCLRALRTGDVVVAWKLDRLGRTLAHLVNTVQDLSARGVGLRVLTGHGAQPLARRRSRSGRLRPRLEGGRLPVAGPAARRAAGRSRCRKPRCGWPRPRWRTATPPCPHSAVNSGSPP